MNFPEDFTFEVYEGGRGHIVIRQDLRFPPEPVTSFERQFLGRSDPSSKTEILVVPRVEAERIAADILKIVRPALGDRP